MDGQTCVLGGCASKNCITRSYVAAFLQVLWLYKWLQNNAKKPSFIPSNTYFHTKIALKQWNAFKRESTSSRCLSLGQTLEFNNEFWYKTFYLCNNFPIVTLCQGSHYSSLFPPWPAESVAIFILTIKKRGLAAKYQVSILALSRLLSLTKYT